MAGRRIKPGSFVESTGPYGTVEEHASTCAHCQRITTFPNLKVMHQYIEVCRSCMRMICLECAGKPCRPWEKEMERQEARGRFLRDIAKHS